MFKVELSLSNGLVYYFNNELHPLLSECFGLMVLNDLEFPPGTVFEDEVCEHIKDPRIREMANLFELVQAKLTELRDELQAKTQAKWDAVDEEIVS